MITEMKKLDLLLYHREQTQFLISLRDSGVVHISERYETLSPEAEQLRGELVRIDRVISELKRRKAKVGATESDGEKLLDLYEKCHADRERLQQKLANVHKDITTLEPWGSFDPVQIEKLRKRNIFVRFFEISDHQVHLFEGVAFELIHKKGSTCWIVPPRSPTKCSPGPARCSMPNPVRRNPKAFSCRPAKGLFPRGRPRPPTFSTTADSPTSGAWNGRCR